MTHSLILSPLRRTSADAERFARVVHEGQTDKAGRPYVEHLERVAKAAAKDAVKFYGFTFESLELDGLRQIAWLHDVIEDERASHRELLDEGFSNNIVMAVDIWLGKHPQKPYREYITDICDRAPRAILIVKLADMEDNADPERLALLPGDVQARLTRKYAEPLAMLRAAVERERA